MLPTLHRKSKNGNQETGLALQRDFDALRHDLFHMFDRMPWSWPAWSDPGMDDRLTATYPVDISEENGTILVDAELPGFSKDQIDVSVENGMLNISAERKSEERKGKKHLHERQYQRVERSFTLPVGVEEGKTKATFENGLLHLELPKSEEAKSHRIAIS